MLGDRLGWTCTLDEKIEAKLSGNLNDVRRQRASDSTTDGVKELVDMEKRISTELNAVRKRLGADLQPLPSRGAIELFLLTGVKPTTQRW